MAGCHEFHVMDVQQNGVFVCPIKNCTKPNQAAFCFTDQCRYKVREVYTTHCNFIYFFNSCLFPVSLVPIHIKICHFALQHPYIHIPLNQKKRPGDVSQSCSSCTRVGWTGLGMQVPWCGQFLRIIGTDWRLLLSSNDVRTSYLAKLHLQAMPMILF